MLDQDHYIYRLRAACVEQPHLNRHQLAALDRELLLVRTSATPEEHLKAGNDMLGLARGAALDRAANAFDTARRHDDPWGAAAAAIEFEHALQGANHVELILSIQSGHQRASQLRSIALELHSAFSALFLNLLHVHTSNFELEPAYAAIDAAFRTLRDSDPAFQPNTWHDQPRYRRRLPWDCDLIHQWLEPYWDDAEGPPPIPAAPAALDSPPLPAAIDWPPAEPLDATPDTALADLYLRRQSDWPDAFLAAFWTEARREVLAARSPVAQYAVARECEARFSAESTRNLLHFTALLAPLRALANHGWQRSPESREGLDKALAVTPVLTGLAPAEIVESPRIQHFFANNLSPRLEYGVEGFGALAGEAGFDLLRHTAVWQSIAGDIEFAF